MSMKYLPIKMADVTSERLVNDFFHPVVPMCDEDRQILGSCKENNAMDHDPNYGKDVLGENTNYAPNRSYISTPAGNDKADDQTKSVQELDHQEENKPILDEPEEEDPSTLEEGAVPRSIVAKQIKTALGQTGGSTMRSRIDVIRDHVRYNAQFINTLFYSSQDSYLATKETVEKFPFLNYFYPNMITHNFYARLHTSLG